ncbi:MAG TPA: hypothetical protein VFP34_06090 [Microlunatus sp.]|jgi:hypothetical protein|nr:hypothetical protein [Microlunatus sp.]
MSDARSPEATRHSAAGAGPEPDDLPANTAESGIDPTSSRGAPPPDTDDLWYRRDPKIEHIPWTEAVEHPAEQFGES